MEGSGVKVGEVIGNGADQPPESNFWTSGLFRLSRLIN
jgi:hypothetical protein